jgi:hypothetical protein
MFDQKHTISVSEFQHLLSEAATDAADATAAWCARQPFSGSPDESDTTELEEALAWIAARATDEAWSLLTADNMEARAPIVWAVHEIVEWAEHLVRYDRQGDHLSRVPITWLPTGAHPLGTRDLAAAVEERVHLLREELTDYGVVVTVTRVPDLAA